MPTGDEQRDERKGRRGIAEERRQKVAFEMVDADRRHAQGVGESVGGACADQQSAGEPGPSCVGDATDVSDAQPGLVQDLACEGQNAADVVARGELGNHAAVLRMHRHLRVQGMREQTAAGVVQGYAGFIAGAFDAEDDHGGCDARGGLLK
jgi:hypothetical protein